MTSQLITVGWLVTILTGLNTVNVDVVNINILITDVVRNRNLNRFTIVADQLT